MKILVKLAEIYAVVTDFFLNKIFRLKRNSEAYLWLGLIIIPMAIGMFVAVGIFFIIFHLHWG